ncbi:YjcG family protein [Bacillus massilinigeriensis]|uniref:YjcG family protein n=1 Tax=Bacillus massilionigeriensis TaxID=1805475 RepID=UPI00096B531C|nr:YjcG family protein [Bacillus massilionigeriensis]
MKFGIVVFPSKKLQDLANSYRKRYDPHYALITPHLTLKNPFEASEESIKDATKRLNEIAESVNPFLLKVTKISSFKPVNNVIYLKVEPTDELQYLNQQLNTNFLGEPSEFSFVPHITIGQKLSNDEHSDVYSTLRLQQIQHEETIDRFHLLYQLENGSWTVYETFHLGKE